MNEVVETLREQLGDPKGDFVSMLTFPKNGKVEKKYVMEFEYRKKNANGEFQKKISTMNVAISHNPWTGEKLK